MLKHQLFRPRRDAAVAANLRIHDAIEDEELKLNAGYRTMQMDRDNQVISTNYDIYYFVLFCF